MLVLRIHVGYCAVSQKESPKLSIVLAEG